MNNFVYFDWVEPTSAIFEHNDGGFLELRAFGVIHTGEAEIPCQIVYEDEPFFDTRPEDEREPELFIVWVILEDGTRCELV